MDQIKRIFYESLANDNLDMVKYLVKERVLDEIHTYNMALTYACRNGYFDFVKYIVEECNVDITYHRNIAIRHTCRNGHLNIVKYLYNKGADVTDRYGGCLFNVCEYDHLHILKYLINNTDADVTRYKYKSIKIAQLCHHLHIVKYLLTLGINDMFKHIYPHLWMNIELIKFITDIGIDYTIISGKFNNEYGPEPVHLRIGVRNKNIKLIKKLDVLPKDLIGDICMYY